MSTTSTMFHSLLGGSTPASPELQEQAYRYADRTGNTNLLTRLASYSELDPALEAKLRDREELDVLLAWASRPNRTQEEVVARFASEKRATLLDRMANSAGLPAEVYEYIGKRNAVGLNWALLENQAAPHEVRLAAAKSLGATTSQRNNGLYPKLHPLLSVEVDLCEAFVEESSNPAALGWLASSWPTDRSAEVLAAVARSTLRILKDGDFDCLYAVRSLASRTDLDQVAEDILVEDICSTAISLNNPSTWALTEVIDEVSRYRERKAFDSAAWLESISSAATPMLIMQAVSDYQSALGRLRLRHDFQAVALAVLSNPNVDASLVRTYAPRGLTESTARAIAERAVESRSLPLAEAVLHQAWVVGLDLLPDFYHASDDPAALLRWFTSSDTKSVPSFVTGSSLVQENPQLAMAYLPAAVVMGNYLYTSEVRKRLESLEQANDKFWDTFTTLAEEWEDSFDSLLAAVEDLARE